MMAYALRVNDYLSGMFAGVGLRLIDFKLEFGRQYDGDMVRLLLADEISPDSCRLWDEASGEPMDKDRFRKDLGGVVDGYREVAKRLGVLRDENDRGESKGPVLVSSNDGPPPPPKGPNKRTRG